MPHLSYVGDAEIGVGLQPRRGHDHGELRRRRQAPHRRSATTCAWAATPCSIAPVTVGDGAYTAAGSVVTDAVPPGAMAVARARQRNIEGWVERRRPGSPAAEAAAAATAHQASGTATAGSGDSTHEEQAQ